MSDIIFNKNASEYKPKSKNTTDNSKLQINEGKNDKLFNLNASEYKPKDVKVNVYDKNEDDLDLLDEEAEDDDDNHKIDDEVLKDLLLNGEVHLPDINDVEEESDDDKWFPKHKDCTCCNGFIYKCEGEVCGDLGVCYCKAAEDEYDDEDK